MASVDAHAHAVFKAGNSTGALNVSNITFQSDIFFLCMGMAAPSISIISITDNMPANQKPVWYPITNPNASQPSMDCWFAVSPYVPPNGQYTVTVAVNASPGNWSLELVAFSGLDISLLQDGAALTSNGSASIPTITNFSTTNPHDTIIAFTICETSLAQTAGAGFTLIQNGTQTGESTASEWEAVNAVQTNVTVAFGTSSGTGVAWRMVVFAFQTIHQVIINNIPFVNPITSPQYEQVPDGFPTVLSVQAPLIATTYSPGTSEFRSFSQINAVNDSRWIERNRNPLRLSVDAPLVSILLPPGLPDSFRSSEAVLSYKERIEPRTYPSKLTVDPSYFFLLPPPLTPTSYSAKFEEILSFMENKKRFEPTNLTVPAPVQGIIPPPLEPQVYSMPQAIDAFLSFISQGYPVELSVFPPDYPDLQTPLGAAQSYTLPLPVIDFLLDAQSKYPRELSVAPIPGPGIVVLGSPLTVTEETVGKGTVQMVIYKGYVYAAVVKE